MAVALRIHIEVILMILLGRVEIHERLQLHDKRYVIFRGNLVIYSLYDRQIPGDV